MASIKAQYPVRYCIDNLDTSSSGVIITKAGSELDCTSAEEITGFNIDAVQPVGTVIKFIFRDSGNTDWFKLNASGYAEKISLMNPEYEDIELHGNTVSELNALTSVPAFTGKKIITAIGLKSQDIKNAVPKIKFGLKAKNSVQILTHTEYSPLYELGTEKTIADITPRKNVTGDAEINISAQVTGAAGEVSDWLPLSSVRGQKCTKIKLRADYSVRGLNSGTAKLDQSVITYSDGDALVTGAGTSEIVSYTQDWYMNVRNCRMNIRHNELIDSEINAYVCFREKPEVIEFEQLGIGTGKRATYQILHKDGLRYDSVKLFYDNQRVYDIFDVNTEAGRITCTAPEGAIITVSYEWGYESETWQKMNLYSLISYEDYDVSEYRYTRPESEKDKFMSVCAVKITMTTKTGSISREFVGTGTGKSQTYKLSHIVSDGKISIYSGDTAMSAKSYALTEDSQYVRIAGSSGAKLSASYDWVSEIPVVYQFAAVFAA